MNRRISMGLFLLLVTALLAAGCGKKSPLPGTVKDEALLAGRDAKSFPAADEDYFKAMDGAAALTVGEVKGRNNWIVWTGGNDRFWDFLVSKSFGAVDLLKIISSHPKTPHLTRDKRWEYLVGHPWPAWRAHDLWRSQRLGRRWVWRRRRWFQRRRWRVWRRRWRVWRRRFFR